MFDIVDGPSITLIALVCVLLAGLLIGVARVRRRDETAALSWRPFAGTGFVAVVWLALTGFVAGAGLLQNYNALPPPMFRLFVPGLILAAIGAYSRVGARLADGLGWGVLIGFQAFRIPVELMLSALYSAGKIPVQMTFHGANFDILTGISAAAVAWLASRGYVGRTTILIWNLAGLVLLANIVTLAVLSMPGRLQVFNDGPANTIVFGWPFIWLPTWLVIAAWFGHLLVFRKLMREAKTHLASA